VLGLVGQGRGVPVQARVGLHREPPVAAVVVGERGLEVLGGLEGDLLDDLPADLGLRRGRALGGDRGDPGLPAGQVRTDRGQRDDRVARRADGSPLDRGRELRQRR
jgi:hypothetical protein